MNEPKFKYHVTIEWSQKSGTMDFWDGASIYTINQFGLPGDRYITDISADDMTWMFASEADALIFRLRFSEVVT